MCTCCNGRREVPGIDGKPRPCSRCCSDKFSLWYADAMVAKIDQMTDAELIAAAGGPEAAKRQADECRKMFERVAAQLDERK